MQLYHCLGLQLQLCQCLGLQLCVWILSSIIWFVNEDYGFIDWIIIGVHMMVNDEVGIQVIDKDSMKFTDKRCKLKWCVSPF